MPEANDPHPPPLDPDTKFRLRMTATGMADEFLRRQGTMPSGQWRDYCARRINDALLSELRRPPPKR